MKQAMILAAGFGKRLRPLTEHTPKPLIEVGGKPLIVWHIQRLAQAGVKNLVINHSWLGEQIVKYLGDGQSWGVHIQYSAEPTPLETATGVKRALPLLAPEPFLLISSDIWCPWPVQKLLAAGRQLDGRQRLGHLLLVDNPPHHPHGDMYFDPKPYVQSCPAPSTPSAQAAPSTSSAQAAPLAPSVPAQGQSQSLATNTTAAKLPAPCLTYSGLAILHPNFFHDCPTERPQALRVPLKKAMKQQQLTAEHIHSPWFDVGTLQRLSALEQYLAQNAQGVMI